MTGAITKQGALKIWRSIIFAERIIPGTILVDYASRLIHPTQSLSLIPETEMVDYASRLIHPTHDLRLMPENVGGFRYTESTLDLPAPSPMIWERAGVRVDAWVNPPHI